MKKSSVIAVVCALVLVLGMAAYIYHAFYARPAGFDECYEELPPPLPKTIVLPPPQSVVVPGLISSEAMLLPDLPALKSMPALRAEAARQKALGSDALMKAVVAFQSRPFIDLFTADDSIRRQAREILFLLAGTDKVAAGSRGRFIDAREIATMERFGGTLYLQLGEFPNPTPPASVHLADSFDKMLDVYFYMLAMSGPGAELYVPTASGILSGFKVELNRKSLDQLVGQAALLKDEPAKLVFWQNSVRILRAALTPLNPLVPELDAAIRASVPGTGLGDVLTTIEGGHDGDEDVNVLTMNHGTFAPEKIAALTEKAKTFKKPEQQTAYWTNVARLARQGLAAGWEDIVATKNLLALDAAIRATAPHENLKAIQERLQAPVTQGDQYYTDAEGHRTLVQVTVTKEKPGRTVCLKRVN